VKRLLVIPLVFLTLPLWSYPLTYKEQIYELYHRHLYAYPERTWENLRYLEEALEADFANPLNALAQIETEKEWEKYRKLFDMHLHLKIIENYLLLGSKFDKQKAYFYNEPYKPIILRSLNVAEKIYQFALPHWVAAKELANDVSQYSYLFIDDAQYWEDEAYRIQTEDLDYEEIINKQLTRLQRVRTELEEMNSYGGGIVADPQEVGQLTDLFKDWEGFIK